MAMSRKALKAMGLTDEQVDSIVEMNAESLAGLKDKLTAAEDKADKAAELQKQLDDANEKIKTLTADDYKAKYETEHAEHTKTKNEFEKLKNDIADKETAAKRETALRTELKRLKYDDDAAETILDSRRNYAEKVKFGDDGKVTNMKEVIGEIQTNHAKYTPKTAEDHHEPSTPPDNKTESKKMTKSEIMKIKDSTQRQAAIAENHDLFGF